MSFNQFAALIHARFNELSKHELFVTAPGDEVWDAYLAAFPEGTNPIYRERTEHDCSCCRNFIRNLGNVVAVVDGKVESIWSVPNVSILEPYDVVAATLDAFVRSRPITGLFRTSEPRYGAAVTYERTPDGGSKAWNHFYGTVAAKHYTKTPEKARGDYLTTVQVFDRGLKELDRDALDTVIDLIEAKTLYRGEEFLRPIREFKSVQANYQGLTSAMARNHFVWAHAGHPAARFRNTVIGTLVTDLSDGVELERAVASFESKVAPTNYKRPTALVTPAMVKAAHQTIVDLGLEPALERRFARLMDVSINDVLWADNSARAVMRDGLAGIMETLATAPDKPNGKAEDISIDDFMAKVLPACNGMDVFVQNKHQGNLMSLTAPVHADVPPLFKWPNNFGWSYNGNITDSIKERVKKAGGSVEGDLCCRLAWDYKDDLDFHMYEPNGARIYYGCRRQLSPSGGMLDLDANGADGYRDDPAENIFYASRRKMREGIYTLVVNNFSRRGNGVGFEVEIEFDGQAHHIVYDKVVRDKESVTVAEIEYKAGAFRIVKSLPSTAKTVSVWGIETESFVKVQTLMKSPNHWDGHAVGNKHWFFVLDGCRNPEPARGIYNEFLAPGLEQHRKVFELLGEKTKCPVVDDQLSGVGFSSTRGDTVQVRVTGPKIRKLYNVNF